MSLGLRASVSSTVFRHLEAAGLRVHRALGRVSKGERIVTAADDPAGLGLSERMRARAVSLRMARRNADQGVDLARASEAALGQVAAILAQLREQAVAFNNGLLGPADLAAHQAEWDQLVGELGRLMVDTELFGHRLLGSSARVPLQVGAEAGQVVALQLTDLEPWVRRLSQGGPLGKPSAPRSIRLASQAIDYVSRRRALLGAAERRLSSAGSSLDQSGVDLAASEGRIRDADLAHELAELTAAVLVQLAAVGVLAQANRSGRLVLELLEAVPPPVQAEGVPRGGAAEPPGVPQGPVGGPSGPGTDGFSGRKDRFRGNVRAG